jgi:hypothetical protein
VSLQPSPKAPTLLLPAPARREADSCCKRGSCLVDSRLDLGFEAERPTSCWIALHSPGRFAEYRRQREATSKRQGVVATIHPLDRPPRWLLGNSTDCEPEVPDVDARWIDAEGRWRHADLATVIVP